MFIHFSCIRTLSFLLLVLCCDYVFYFSPSFSLLDRLRKAPKCKSTHIRFRDVNAYKDFSKNFSKRGVHSKRHVVLLDFFDTTLPTVIHSRGWESFCEILVSCPIVIIQEFYSNMHGFDTSIPQFAMQIRGTRIVVTPELVSEILYVPRVSHPDYLACPCLRTVSKDELLSLFCETPSS